MKEYYRSSIFGLTKVDIVKSEISTLLTMRQFQEKGSMTGSSVLK